MILVSKTYEIVTQESAEHGDAEERGFEFTDEPFTFRELVHLMREHPYCSSGGHNYTPSERDWFSSYPEQNYRDGSDTTTSIHFSRSNNPRLAKYWAKAAKLAK